MAMGHQVLISLADDVLSVYVNSQRWSQGQHCRTLHVEVECASAASFSSKARYQPLRAWACDAPAAAGQQRCKQHWFGSFVCCSQDGQPVAMASSTQQFAVLLHVSEVRVCDMHSLQPLVLPGITTDLQDSHRQQQQQVPLPPPPPPPPQQQPQPQQQLPVLALSGLGFPADSPLHNLREATALAAAAAVAGGGEGTDATAPGFTAAAATAAAGAAAAAAAGQWSSSQPSSSRAAAGQALPWSAAAAAAAAAGGGGDLFTGAADSPPLGPQQQQGGVQKRNSAEAELPLPGSSKAQRGTAHAGPEAAAAATGRHSSSTPQLAGSYALYTAVLRLKLSPEDAALQQQGQGQGQQQQQGDLQQQQQQLQQQQQQQQQGELRQLCWRGLDVPLPTAEGGSKGVSLPRCPGVNLVLGVADLRQLLQGSTYIRVLRGQRCGEVVAGAKRVCKKHTRGNMFVLQSSTGSPLLSTTDLHSLAHRLKVSSASILDATSHEPLPDYAPCCPATPTWSQPPGSSSLAVWLPPDAKSLPGNWQSKPCCGLDFYLDGGGDLRDAMGQRRPLVLIMRCGNEVGAKATCKRHTGASLQLLSWHDSLAGSIGTLNTIPGEQQLGACADLAQLAMWLGLDKVEVRDADSRELLPFYVNLAIAPAVQLPLPPPPQQQLGSAALLAPPTLPGLSELLATATGAAKGHTEAAAGARSAAAAAAGVEGMQVDSTRLSLAAAGGAAAESGVDAIVAALTAAAEGGELTAINLVGNSMVKLAGQLTDKQQQQDQDQEMQQDEQEGQQQQQQQEQQQQEQQQQEQQQGHEQGVTIYVKQQPAGGNQGRPCRMLHVVLLTPDGASYTPGRQYPILFAHRCGNEAGNRSRCRVHTDTAARVYHATPRALLAAAAAQGLSLVALQASRPVALNAVALGLFAQEATLLGKANSSRELAALLGLQGGAAAAVRLCNAATGDDLGDLAAWSPTNPAGCAAKLNAAAPKDPAAAAATAAALAAVAAAGGVPGLPSAQAVLAALQQMQVPGLQMLGAGMPLTVVQQIEPDTKLAPAHTPPAPAPAAAAGEQLVNGGTTQQQQQHVLDSNLPVQQDAAMSDGDVPAAGAANGVQPASDAAAAAVAQAAAASAAAVVAATPAAAGGSGFGSSAPRRPLKMWAVNFRPQG